MLLAAVVIAVVVVLLSLYYLLFSTTSRNNDKQLIVVLDLDECLIHADRDGCRGRQRQTQQQENLIESFQCYFPKLRRPDKANNNNNNNNNAQQQQQKQPSPSCQVFLRPGWNLFLESLLSQPDKYEVHIFTASEENYARPILAELERRLSIDNGSSSQSNNNNHHQQSQESRFSQCWFRDSCRTWTFMNHSFTFKDLSILQRQPLMHRMVLVDDDPTNFTDNPDHAIPIKPYLGDDPLDNSLVRVGQLLQKLAGCSDVRPILQQRFGMAAAYREAESLHAFVPKQWEHVMTKSQAVQL